MRAISTIAELETVYGAAPLAPATTLKVTRFITTDYAALIRKSPFLVLASAGPEGLDCSPRGDQPGFVRQHDPTTLLIPDRKGNNRIDSLRNIVRDSRVALFFMIPGVGTTLRVNGHARITTDDDLRASFSVGSSLPRSVLIVSVSEVYFQCARAIVRSKLWEAESRVDPSSVPTPGSMIACLDEGFDGESYDREWPAHAARSLW